MFSLVSSGSLSALVEPPKSLITVDVYIPISGYFPVLVFALICSLRRSIAMGSRTTDSAFVVVTGDPQSGNGERISQVRSHLAKQYHQNARQKKSRVSETRKKQAYIPRSYTSQSLPREIHLTLDPSQLFASATGFQRMQRSKCIA